MIHINSNRLCVVVGATTGALPNHHDLIEICFLPLKGDLTPDGSIPPFHFLMHQKRVQNVDFETMRKNKIKLPDTILRGIDPWKASDLFEEWTKKFNFAWNKRIVPVTHNWATLSPFLVDWLQPSTFDRYIDNAQARDIMIAALYINDVADFHNEPIPYPKTRLKYIASTHKLDTSVMTDTLIRAYVVSQVYRRLALRGLL